MAELADAADSKSADLRVLGVRLPLPAPNAFSYFSHDDPLGQTVTRGARDADPRHKLLEFGFYSSVLA
jgi:hypothetical protein